MRITKELVTAWVAAIMISIKPNFRNIVIKQKGNFKKLSKELLNNKQFETKCYELLDCESKVEEYISLMNDNDDGIDMEMKIDKENIQALCMVCAGRVRIDITSGI